MSNRRSVNSNFSLEQRNLKEDSIKETILSCHLSLTLMMTSTQTVETSVNVTSNSPSQDYTHPDDHNLRNYDMTPGFKPFTI